MIKKLLAVSISLAFSATAPIVHAEGDVNAGKQQAAACAGCHGENGNSAVSTFPKLAGQHATYLVRELKSLKVGLRDAPMMAPLAMGLSEKDIDDLAAFYESQTTSENPLPQLPFDDDDDEDEEDEAAVEAKKKAREEKLQNMIAKGRDLYRNGDLEDEVSACIACHGPDGTGNEPAAFPVLKGQHADYIIKTLTDFKKGKRLENPEDMMNMIAKKMSEDEIQAVAYYLSIMGTKADK